MTASMTGGARYLLDTNVLSETRKKQPDQHVISFLSKMDPSALYFSVLTLGELRKGVAMKGRTEPEIARQLSEWVDGLEFSFADRIVSVDAATASLWGRLSAERPRPVIGTLLAATASVHAMTLVTRNTADIGDIAIQILNPWQ
jgi:predicted nucleic acid-binding protein